MAAAFFRRALALARRPTSSEISSGARLLPPSEISSEALAHHLPPSEISSGPIRSLLRHGDRCDRHLLPRPPLVLSSHRTPARLLRGVAPPPGCSKAALSTAALNLGSIGPKSIPLPQNPTRLLGSASNTTPTRAPPTSHVMEFDTDEWVEVKDYVAEISLLKNQNENRLFNHGDPVRGPFDFSGPMKSVSHSIVELVVRNANKGYCIQEALKEDNILVSRTHHHVRLKSVVGVCDLTESNSTNELTESNPVSCELVGSDGQKSRTCSFRAGQALIITMLQRSGGDQILSRLSEQPKDLLYKMSVPSDDRFIVFHTTFLGTEGMSSLGQTICRLVCKEWRHSPKKRLKIRSSNIARSMPNCRRHNLWTDIASNNPFLDCAYQLSLNHQKKMNKGQQGHTPLQPGSQPQQPGSPQQGKGAHLPQPGSKPQLSQGPQLPQPGSKPQLSQGSQLPQPGKPQWLVHAKEGYNFIGYYRNVPNHCFDPEMRRSYSKVQGIRDYTYDEVIGLIDHEYPKFLTYAVEAFLAYGAWDDLHIDQFFPKVFGEVPIPDYDDAKAHWTWYRNIILMRKDIKKSSKRRRKRR